MDLKVIHDYIREQLGQERGGYESPGEIDGWLHRAQMEYFTEEVEEYSRTQKVQDSLGPFSTKFTYTSTSGGLVSLPLVPTVTPCYEHLLSIWAQYFDNTLSKTRYKPIKIISEDELPNRLNSQILEPTVEDPVGIEEKPGIFQLYPATTISGFGYYFKTPVPPVFVFTQSGRVITYNQSGSTQMEWNESSMNKILLKTLVLAGVNLSDAGMVQYADAKGKEDI